MHLHLYCNFCGCQGIYDKTWLDLTKEDNRLLKLNRVVMRHFTNPHTQLNIAMLSNLCTNCSFIFDYWQLYHEPDILKSGPVQKHHSIRGSEEGGG